MSISVDGFSTEITAANILAQAKASDVPAVVALEDALREGQVYLSAAEVFSTDLVNQAFVSADGADLRGPLALRNVRTAVNLCNWLDTDTILRTCWSLNAQLAEEIAADVPEFAVRDRAWLRSVFDRLTRENPPPASETEALARFSADVEPPRILSTGPANTWLTPASQIVLRIWFITRIARDHTAMELELGETWYQLANKEKNVSRSEFERVFQVELSGIGAADRGVMGIGGNFFKDLGKSLTKLFRHPLQWMRSALREFGKAVAFSGEPFAVILDWIGKQIGMPALFKHPVRLLMEQLGNVLKEGSITAFKEQDLAFDLGHHLTQAGAVLAAVAGIVGAIFPPIGAILGAVAALMIAVGQGILAMQRVLREQRLAKLAGMNLPIPATPQQTANMQSNSYGASAAAGGSAGGGLALLLVLALGAA